MDLKNILLGIAILILTIFVTFYGINTVFPKGDYNDYCRESGPKVCPAVCVPMYEIIDGQCQYTECGSGCGPDGIYTFGDEDSCQEGLKLSDQKKCEIQNGSWVRQEIQCVKAPCPQGYCDTYSQCSQEYEDAMRDRSRKVFLLALPLGIIIIAAGAFFFGLESVGAGLMGGGVGTLIYGSGAYWPYTENWVRFLLSLLGLVILIWFAYFFSRRRKRK